MKPTTQDLLRLLRHADASDAERYGAALKARANDVWPALREAVAAAVADRDTEMVWISRLQDVCVALPSPLDVPLLFFATVEGWAAGQFVDVLFFKRIDEVVESALRFLASEEETERRVATSLLHQLIPRTGAMHYVDAEPEVVFDPSAESILLEALRGGVDAYVVAQLLIRHGWALDDALPALRRAVEEELKRDELDSPEDFDGIGYDLGCDLQVVATTLLHAGAASRAHVDLLRRMYDGGDLALRGVILESIVGIGGEASRSCVQRWSREYPKHAKELDADVPPHEVGFRLRIDAALGLLEGRSGGGMVEELFPRTQASFFAAHAFHRFLPRIHASDPEGVEAVLRRLSQSGDAEASEGATLCLQELGL